jgi:flagellar motor switch protein FliN/FliY
MIVDQDEIEALLAQADDLAAEAGEEVHAAAIPAPAPDAGAPATAPPPPRPPINVSSEVARILRIQVPVRVQLASRQMSIAEVRKLSLGRIIEFHKAVDDPLDLLINNHQVGRGVAVKVGEHFGLRVSEIRDAATRIKSMGK